MKNQLRKPTKLSLRKETVRQLDHLELAELAGGSIIVLPTRIGCPTFKICDTTPNDPQ